VRTTPTILVAAALLAAGCGGGARSAGVLGQPVGPCDDVVADAEDDIAAHANELRVWVEDWNATSPELRELEQDIESIDGVRSTSVTTKEEAFERAKELFRDDPDVLENLPGNPFPASVDVSADRDRVDAVREAIDELSGIDEVTSYGDRSAQLIDSYRAGEAQDEVCTELVEGPSLPDGVGDAPLDDQPLGG
jgi:hypothetical protein